MPYAQRVHKGRSHRDDSKPFFNSKAWKELRKVALARQPICADPFGVHRERDEVIESKDVHHIQSRESHPELALVLENLECLCKSCHSRLTQEERRAR